VFCHELFFVPVDSRRSATGPDPTIATSKRNDGTEVLYILIVDESTG
jgi:hypothetical protein